MKPIEIYCAECGKPTIVYSGAGKYCSTECTHNAKNRRRNKKRTTTKARWLEEKASYKVSFINCRCCGKLFTSRRTDREVCSLRCKENHRFRKETNDLTNSYLRSRIKQLYRISNPPNSLIQTKRCQIMIKRIIGGKGVHNSKIEIR